MDRGAWQATQRVRVCKESGMTEQLSLTHSAFFMVQLSHPYVTTGEKTIALTLWTFVTKVMSLLFNMLSRFVTAFLSRNKHPLISWAIVAIRSDFGAQENKTCLCFHFSPFYVS